MHKVQVLLVYLLDALVYFNRTLLTIFFYIKVYNNIYIFPFHKRCVELNLMMGYFFKSSLCILQDGIQTKPNSL
jgi:hypothetical protein